MKAKAWLAGALAVPLLVIWFHHVRNPPPGNPVQAPARGGVLRIMTQAVDSLDPIHSRNYWESGIVLQLFDGLVRLDEHLAIAPAIARDWRISFDGTTYTFRLRRDVRFHNGRPVTARDFVYSLTRLVDPRWKAVDSEYYARIGGAAAFRSGRSDHVSGFRALDSHTLQITLEQPYAPFLQVLALSSASVVPREAVESRERPFDRSPVGTGAFRLMRPGSGHEIHLESHPRHFLGRPYLDELRIRTVAALTDRESFREFARGRLDLSFIPTDRIPQASARPDWEVRTFPVLRLLYLGMNVKAPGANRRLLRKAVCLAIDPAAVYGGLSDFEPTDRLIPFSLLGSQRITVRMRNLEAARAILRQLEQRQGPLPRLSLWTSARLPAARRRVEHLLEGPRSIGLKIDVRRVNSMRELLDRIYAGRAPMFLLGEVIDFPDPDALLSRLFHSRSNGNPFGYANPEVDRLLRRARGTLDETRRARLYRRIEEQIQSDHVVAPLALVRYSLVHRRQVRGLEINSLGFQHFHFRKVWLAPE
ncbi:MAG: ABC transporter substrate-binding protein [Acidobacteria bacterium]|nr:ABC transporter substrate-binding protein [Acidobacteriota bacterium]